jgi:CheY-like chemotaxis protein
MTQKKKEPVHPLRILVVDDEQSVPLRAVRMTLEFYGYEVTTCTSGLRLSSCVRLANSTLW